jgi:hypothetical protein
VNLKGANVIGDIMSKLKKKNDNGNVKKDNLINSKLNT